MLSQKRLKEIKDLEAEKLKLVSDIDKYKIQVIFLILLIIID